MRALIVGASCAAALALGVVLWLWVAGFTRLWCPDQAIYFSMGWMHHETISRPGACVPVHRLPDWVAALSGLTGCVAVLAAGRGVDGLLERRRRGAKGGGRTP